MRNPTKVAMFTPSAAGGHARYTQELLEALAERGEPRRIAPALVTSEDLAAEHDSTAYPIHRVLPGLTHRREIRGRLRWIGSRLAHYPKRERTLLRWAAAQPGLGVIHFQEHAPWLAPWLYETLRRRGVKVVETVHNIQLHRYWNALHRRVLNALERAAWRRADALIVHTEGLRASLSEFLGRKHPPIHVTPHAVWGGRSGTSGPARTTPNGPILFFGVVRENKGLHVLLRAMERLPGHRLVVAGASDSDAYRATVRSAVGAMPPGAVEWRDAFVSQAEAAALFDACSLVVLPYTSFASQSGVLHQAVAHGRPVVVSDVGALGESVREWGVGEVVAPGDPAALADAITKALRPEAYRDAAEASARVRAGRTWGSMAEATLDVYQSVLA